MLRALLLLAALFATPAATLPLTITVTAGSCPQGAAYADGCQGAQATGSVQVLGLLTSYAHRPPWNVAAVDYPIGYAGALADPAAGSLPSCATLNTLGSDHYSVTITAACGISGFDFSLHNGICVTVAHTSGTVTLSNDRFGWGTNCNGSGGQLVTVCPGGSYPSCSGGSPTTNILYDEFDGSYSAASQSLLETAGAAQLTVRYSAFLKSDQADIGNQVSGTGTITASFNYSQDMGCCGNHSDWLINNAGSGTFIVRDSFETLNPGTGTSVGTWCYITTGYGSTGGIAGYCRNNTYLGGLASPNPAYFVQLDIGTGQSVNGFDVSSNYMAQNNSYGFFYPGNASHPSGTITNLTCSGNVNMATGAAAAGTIGTTNCQ